MITKVKPITPNHYRDNKLEIAKKVPILNLFPNPEKLREVGNKYMTCCPFHEEKNPSFAIYKETNSWTCFAGCGSGDSVAFLMKLYGIDFREAVERLQR